MNNHSTCCVVGCKNNGVKSGCKFYKFPVANHRILQRKRWIAALQRYHQDGSAWNPKPSDKICSAHFVGNRKSEEEISPSYVPTIFSPANGAKVKTQTEAMRRHHRFMKRRMTHREPSSIKSLQKVTEESVALSALDVDNNSTTTNSSGWDQRSVQKKTCDQGCQADIFSINQVNPEKTFICNRYIRSGEFCSDAEIQTEIITNPGLIIVPNQRQFKDKRCGTTPKTFKDQSVGPNIDNNDLTTSSNFAGIESIKNDEQLLDLAGVTTQHFQFLLRRLDNVADNCKISKENRLFIFLVKIKTGLTYSAISVFFTVHRTTVSRIFRSTLRNLSAATANLVFWPSKDVVQATMPDCFHPDYSNTRVIIDCTEFRIEVPASVENRVYTYSHYKKGFTAKLLIGITPAGFISFKSKVAGGRKSDSQMTIESGLVDLLENGDAVLADKGFPEIRRIIDNTGKKVLLVMPPFLEKKAEFTKEETEDTYNIARVRIHVERIMQRLRTHQILSKIPTNLFDCIDDIVHVCCVLVNLQPPIIADKNTDKNKPAE